LRATATIRRTAAVLTALLVGGSSALVTVAPASAASGQPVNAVIVDGRGYGHGIGLSQWGAYGWATRYGWNWQQILAFYYGGTSLGPVAPTDFTGTPVGSVTVRLVALDNAQTAVVQDAGQATTSADPLARPFASLVAREWPGQRNIYKVWGKATAECPAATANLDDPASGWVPVAEATAGPVTFMAPRGAADDAAVPGELLGLCEPAGTVRYYRGSLRAMNGSDGENRTVNEVALEWYTKGVVPRESPASWGDAAGGAGMNALRAQAVAARTYALAEGGATSRFSYAKTCDTQACQVYGGAATRPGVGGAVSVLEDARTNRAVDETAGIVDRKPDGQVALTMFSSSNGGRSLGGLFPAVDDAGDAVADNPNYNWAVQIAAGQFEQKWPQIGSLRDVSVTARSNGGPLGGYADQVRISGTSGSVTITGDAFRTAFGLKSRWFATTPVAQAAPSEPAVGRLLVVGDSVGASINAGLTQLLQGAYTDLQVDTVGGRCTVGSNCVGPDGLTVVRSAPTPAFALLELGYNDNPPTFGGEIDQVLAALTARGVSRVLWVNLSERRPGGSGSFYAPANAALRAAATRWPQLTVLDWNATSSGDEATRWFLPGSATTPDLVHLTETGRAKFSQWLRQQLDDLRAAGGLPGTAGAPPVAPTPPAPTGRPTLRLGDRSTAVQQMQAALTANGIRTTADGIFGPVTERNVRSFQSLKGLPVTGVVDDATWAALGITAPAASSPAPAPAAPSPPTLPTLQRGARGSAVVTLQSALTRNGIRTTADGIFGPTTQKNVTTFQSRRALRATGVVDAATWSALGVSTLVSATPTPAPASPPPSSRPTVRRGSTGTAVTELQYVLVLARFTQTVNGKFGPQTEGNVRTFQSRKGLPVTGVVDAATWSALGFK
jgi:SpoIID/LytB domain protein